MSEVDGNLNYLLGKLGLVTQEFNAIKHGLGDALDNIRSSFAVVQSKIKGNVFFFPYFRFSRITAFFLFRCWTWATSNSFIR